jgi:hypothetical protein
MDEIVARTNEDLQVSRLLARTGLGLEITGGTGERYLATIFRGRTRHASLSLNVAGDNGWPPSSRDVITATLLRAAMDPKFARRARAFLTEDELKRLEKVL